MIQMKQIMSSSQVFCSLVKLTIVYFCQIQSNVIDGANYEMDESDEAKHEIDGVNHEIDGSNHIKQSSTLKSSQAKYSLFQLPSLMQSSLAMKELLGWSLDTHIHIWPELHDKLYRTAEMDELWKLYLGITHRITRCHAAIWTHQNTFTIFKKDI